MPSKEAIKLIDAAFKAGYEVATNDARAKLSLAEQDRDSWKRSFLDMQEGANKHIDGLTAERDAALAELQTWKQSAFETEQQLITRSLELVAAIAMYDKLNEALK